MVIAVAAGAATEDPGGFVMSSESMAWSTVEHEQHDAVRRDERVSSAHPRGAGFRVLSRLARKRAEAPEYSPRHRVDSSGAR